MQIERKLLHAINVIGYIETFSLSRSKKFPVRVCSDFHHEFNKSEKKEKIRSYISKGSIRRRYIYRPFGRLI